MKGWWLVSNNLSAKQKEVYELSEKGLTNADISKKLDLSPSSVRTYLAKAKKVLSAAVSKLVPPENIVDTLTKGLRSTGSEQEAKALLAAIKVPEDLSLEDRVAAFKKAMCKVCPYPSKCNSGCGYKLIRDHYLGE